jgi:hypothetical protein
MEHFERQDRVRCSSINFKLYVPFASAIPLKTKVLREKVRLKRINLEGNTHAQEINVSQCPI